MSLCDRCHRKIERNRRDGLGLFRVSNPIFGTDLIKESVEVCAFCYDLYKNAQLSLDEEIMGLHTQRAIQIFRNWFYNFEGGGVESSD